MGKHSHPVAFKMGLAFTFSVIPTPAFAHLVNTKVGEFYAGIPNRANTDPPLKMNRYEADTGSRWT
jgi:hypothetical protein